MVVFRGLFRKELLLFNPGPVCTWRTLGPSLSPFCCHYIWGSCCLVIPLFVWIIITSFLAIVVCVLIMLLRVLVILTSLLVILMSFLVILPSALVKRLSVCLILASVLVILAFALVKRMSLYSILVVHGPEPLKCTSSRDQQRMVQIWSLSEGDSKNLGYQSEIGSFFFVF